MLLNDVLKSYGAIEKIIKTSLFNEVRKEVEKHISILLTEEDFLSMVDDVKKNHKTTHVTLFSTNNNFYVFTMYCNNEDKLCYNFLSCDKFTIEHSTNVYKNCRKCTKVDFEFIEESDDKLIDNYEDIVKNKVLYFLDDLIFNTPISEL